MTWFKLWQIIFTITAVLGDPAGRKKTVKMLSLEINHAKIMNWEVR